MLEQRQCPWLRGHRLKQRRLQPLLQSQPGPPGRADNGLFQLVGSQGPHQCSALVEQLAHVNIAERSVEHVGAQCHHYA